MANTNSPLASQTQYVNFPVDEYVDACIISYQVASLPPSKFSKSHEPVPSVRFLLAGYVKNEAGEEVVVRKWTSWKAISYNEKSGLSALFKGVANLQDLLTDDKQGGALWTTTFKIMLEAAKEGKYSNVTRVKVAPLNEHVMEIVYSSEFAPYKTVGAYGKAVFLDVAVNKEADGVKYYSGDQLIDPPDSENDD